MKAELFYGAVKSANPEENLEKVHLFLRRFVSLPFDDESSEEYGRIRSGLRKKGTPIGPNDLLIAAIAQANNVTVVTQYERIRRVTGFKFEDWQN